MNALETTIANTNAEYNMDKALAATKRLEFIILDPSGKVIDGFHDHIAGLEDYHTFTHSYATFEDVFKHVKVDCIIAPGNSYGHMTGGLDKAIVDALGLWLQRSVLYQIHTSYLGELSVGQAMVVRQPNWVPKDHPTVIYAPTMRVPMELPQDNDVPYRAMLASLQKIDRINTHVKSSGGNSTIQSVLVPLFGAGTGGMNPYEVLRQIVLAIGRYTHRPTIRDLFKDGTLANQVIMG